MLNLLERHAASIERRLVVLAPPAERVPPFFQRVTADDSKRADWLRAVQQLRGSVYVADGAIQPQQLTADGRHTTPEDERAWHILTRDQAGLVTSCIWYLEHRNAQSIYDVRTRHCPLVRTKEWRDRIREAVASEMAAAKDSGVRFAEVGGWAVAPEHRCTGDGLILALAAFSLSLSLGGAIGLTTATVRHSSAVMLRRLGLAPLEVKGGTVPTYYDPAYQCDMELLRFDSRRPSPKYLGVVDLLRERLEVVNVFANLGPALQPRAVALEPSFAA